MSPFHPIRPLLYEMYYSFKVTAFKKSVGFKCFIDADGVLVCSHTHYIVTICSTLQFYQRLLWKCTEDMTFMLCAQHYLL